MDKKLSTHRHPHYLISLADSVLHVACLQIGYCDLFQIYYIHFLKTDDLPQGARDHCS